MARITLTDVQEDLAYLLGETSVPTSGVEDRVRFIQRSLERIYRLYDFEMNKLTATVSLVSGVGVLPSNAREDADLDIRVVNSGSGDDDIFEAIPYGDQDKYEQGDFKYWLTTDPTTGYSTINSKEGDTDVLVRYTSAAPIINASVSTPFPSAMVIAKGALVYYRQAEDPQADVIPEEQAFIQELKEVMAAHNRNKPRARAKSIAEVGGYSTGQRPRSYYGDSSSS